MATKESLLPLRKPPTSGFNVVVDPQYIEMKSKHLSLFVYLDSNNISCDSQYRLEPEMNLG